MSTINRSPTYKRKFRKHRLIKRPRKLLTNSKGNEKEQENYLQFRKRLGHESITIERETFAKLLKLNNWNKHGLTKLIYELLDEYLDLIVNENYIGNEDK